MSLLTTKPNPFALNWEAESTVPLTIYYNRLDGTIPTISLGAGAEIWVTFKNSLLDPEPGVLQKTLSAGKVVITDAVNGIATAYMTPLESTIADMQVVYQLDVKVRESTNGNEWVAARGTLTLSQTPTRSI